MRGRVNSQGVEEEKEDHTFKKKNTKRGRENRRGLFMLQRWEMSKEKIRYNSRCYIPEAHLVLKTMM